LHNNARIFLFLGKDQCGSSFPPLTFLLPEWLFARRAVNLSAMEVEAGLSGKLIRKVRKPDRPKKIFSPAGGKKN